MKKVSKVPQWLIPVMASLSRSQLQDPHNLISRGEPQGISDHQSPSCAYRQLPVLICLDTCLIRLDSLRVPDFSLEF